MTHITHFASRINSDSPVNMEYLKYLQKVEIPQKYGTLKEFVKSSNNFEKEICKCQTSANWITKRDTEEFTIMANNSYPILHEEVLNLCHNFLKFKQEHGNDHERELYKDMNVIELIERLISKV